MGKNGRDNRLITIFRLTDRCNQKCFFCCQEGRGLGGEPSLDRVKQDLAELRHKSIGTVIFMQGETLLRKDLPEIAEYCREIGFDQIGVATNGTRLADEDFLKNLLRHGVNRFEISIHSHIEGPANLISGRSFTWEKQRRALENLARVRRNLSHLRLNSVICRHNMGHLPELADYFFHRFSTSNSDMMLKHPFIMGAATGATDSIPPYRELDLTSFISHVMTNNLEVRFENLPLCLLPGLEHRSSEAIDKVKGLVYFSRIDGDDAYRDIMEVPSDSVLLDVCHSCPLVSICRGVGCRYIETFGVPGLSPSKADPHEIVRKILEL